ncbi:glycerate kinase [Candidatus Sumerlaeota bacterium]|nr:glycerate kinase [Candidatus Sumerlaeota bacterium]
MRQLSQISGLRRDRHGSGFVILLAPDSFKGSCAAREACEAMAAGIRSVCPKARIISHPLSDGGEGCREILLDAVGGRRHAISVNDPLMRRIRAEYGILKNGKTAVMDMATASGLILLRSKERNPMRTTTYGTGEMIKSALKKGAKKIIMGIGGSATTDGGVGAAQALGCRFLDKHGRILPKGLPGGKLRLIQRIDLSKRDSHIDQTKILVACDVDNPFTGARGAARIYSPQKGASSGDVEILEENLAHLAEIIKRDMGIDLNSVKGSGAAGGLGGGLYAFLGAELQRGIEIILKATRFRAKLKGVDLVLTGEGCLDAQTMNGKVVWGVVKEAGRANIPVVAFAGRIKSGYEDLYSTGLTAAFAITREPVPMAKAMENAFYNIKEVCANVMRLFIKR